MSDNIALRASTAFLEYLETFVSCLEDIKLADAVRDPEKTAIISLDVTNGFCHEGPLASPRVKGIIEPIVDLFRMCWDAGVRKILLSQDTHEPDAMEFGQYPPHCVRGTSESETVPEIKELPFFSELKIIEKNSIHSFLNTDLTGWMEANPQVDTFIVVGDCTDLCVYQAAVHLQVEANAHQRSRRVIVPANAVDTFDMPVETALKVGAMPHDAELLHAVFLYHMALNGIEVVRRIVP